MWQKLTLLNTFFNYIHLFKKIAFFVKLICIFMFFFSPTEFDIVLAYLSAYLLIMY